MKTLLTVVFVAVPLVACAQAQKPPPQKPQEKKVEKPKQEDASKETTASAELKNTEGKVVGDVKLRQTPNGVIIRLKIWDMPEGEHAFHIHEVGKCEPPFKSAGGHYNPRGHQHGIESPKGKHAGDLPNLHVPKSGALEIELFTDGVSLTGDKAPVFDGDGSTFVIHAGADDYSSDPAGNAGDRIACGVIRR